MSHTFKNKNLIRCNRFLISERWLQPDPNTLLIKWDELPFVLASTITWRGVIFHLKINAFRYTHGIHRYLTFLYKDEKYECKLSTFMGGGGVHGVRPPQISTLTHKLNITTSLNSIEFTDTILHSSSSDTEKLRNPFTVNRCVLEDQRFDAC